jgi:hypothetical protein
VSFLLLEHFNDNVGHEKFFSHVNMVRGLVMFGLVIGIVCFARVPIKFELLLAFSVA